ncbi:MAG: hypothetical protein O3A46_16030, partial [Candidatus Poribacteria bacterium]|nr:hypothetical protein [Candidatus Poribacteria bacterium]
MRTAFANRAAWIAWLVAFAFGSVCASAQQSRVVIELFPGVGSVIDADERDAHKFLPDIDGFRSAFVTVGGDGRGIAHITYDEGGDLRYVERPIDVSPEAARALEDVGSSASSDLLASGRLGLVAHTTAYGLFVYGNGISKVADFESGRAQTGTWMLTGGGAFVASLLRTAGYDKGIGYAKMLQNASYAGIYFGNVPRLMHDQYSLQLSPYPTQEEIDEFHRESERRNRAEARLHHYGQMTGLTLTTLGMHYLTRNAEITEGEADMTFWGSVLASGLGVAVPMFILQYDDDLADIERDRWYTGSVAAAIPIGGYLGYRFGHDKRIDAGRSWMMRVGSGVGAIAGLTTALFIDDDDEFDI